MLLTDLLKKYNDFFDSGDYQSAYHTADAEIRSENAVIGTYLSLAAVLKDGRKNVQSESGMTENPAYRSQLDLLNFYASHSDIPVYRPWPADTSHIEGVSVSSDPTALQEEYQKAMSAGADPAQLFIQLFIEVKSFDLTDDRVYKQYADIYHVLPYFSTFREKVIPTVMFECQDIYHISLWSDVFNKMRNETYAFVSSGKDGTDNKKAEFVRLIKWFEKADIKCLIQKYINVFQQEYNIDLQKQKDEYLHKQIRVLQKHLPDEDSPHWRLPDDICPALKKPDKSIKPFSSFSFDKYTGFEDPITGRQVDTEENRLSAYYRGGYISFIYPGCSSPHDFLYLVFKAACNSTPDHITPVEVPDEIADKKDIRKACMKANEYLQDFGYAYFNTAGMLDIDRGKINSRCSYDSYHYRRSDELGEYQLYKKLKYGDPLQENWNSIGNDAYKQAAFDMAYKKSGVRRQKKSSDSEYTLSVTNASVMPLVSYINEGNLRRIYERDDAQLASAPHPASEDTYDDLTGFAALFHDYKKAMESRHYKSADETGALVMANNSRWIGLCMSFAAKLFYCSYEEAVQYFKAHRDDAVKAHGGAQPEEKTLFLTDDEYFAKLAEMRKCAMKDNGKYHSLPVLQWPDITSHNYFMRFTKYYSGENVYKSDEKVYAYREKVISDVCREMGYALNKMDEDLQDEAYSGFKEFFEKKDFLHNYYHMRVLATTEPEVSLMDMKLSEFFTNAAVELRILEKNYRKYILKDKNNDIVTNLKRMIPDARIFANVRLRGVHENADGDVIEDCFDHSIIIVSTHGIFTIETEAVTETSAMRSSFAAVAKSEAEHFESLLSFMSAKFGAEYAEKCGGAVLTDSNNEKVISDVIEQLGIKSFMMPLKEEDLPDMIYHLPNVLTEENCADICSVLTEESAACRNIRKECHDPAGYQKYLDWYACYGDGESIGNAVIYISRKMAEGAKQHYDRIESKMTDAILYGSARRFMNSTLARDLKRHLERESEKHRKKFFGLF